MVARIYRKDESSSSKCKCDSNDKCECQFDEQQSLQLHLTPQDLHISPYLNSEEQPQEEHISCGESNQGQEGDGDRDREYERT